MPQQPSKTLILASSSPYRRQLLARLGLPFTVAIPEIDESPRPHEAPATLAQRLAREKADAIAETIGQRLTNNDLPTLIIGSDQVASSGGQIFGKPGNHANAVTQLQTLSGQNVVFATALCLYNTATRQAHAALVNTEVQFRTLSLVEIKAYLAREAALDCAGSAKAEGLGIALLERLSGDDPTALIGLPLIALCRLLRQAGLDPLLTD